MQWLRDDEIVKELQPNPTGGIDLFISNEDMTTDMSGHYQCRVKRTDNSFTNPVHAGTLTVLGE